MSTRIFAGTGTRMVLAVCLAAGLAWPLAAQEGQFLCRGRVTDAEEKPVVGFRVVYRVVGDIDVLISPPTDDKGEYAVDLPEDAVCAPVAVISPRGRRIEVDDRTPVSPAPGARRDIRLPVVVASGTGGQPAVPGADRLFLAFVEDTARVNRYRWEGRLDYADFDAADVTLARAVAALAIPGWPDVEVGASFGIGGVDFAGAMADDGGATDLDLWAKLRIDPHALGRTRLAAGALVTVPTGNEDAGLSQDGLRSKLFAAVRVPMGAVTLAAHAGVRFNEDGRVLGTPVAGETAAALGVGLYYPWSARLSVVGELGYEGERFAGGSPDSRALLGVNWRALPHGILRLAVSGGLDDGAPDTGVLVGYSFDF